MCVTFLVFFKFSSLPPLQVPPSPVCDFSCFFLYFLHYLPFRSLPPLYVTFLDFFIFFSIPPLSGPSGPMCDFSCFFFLYVLHYLPSQVPPCLVCDFSCFVLYFLHYLPSQVPPCPGVAPTELGCGLPRSGDGRPRGRGPHREQQLRGRGHRRCHRGQVCGEKGNTLWTHVNLEGRGD